jgi:hypothetical protein
MATFNLVRNSRVLFTTNVAAGTGVVAATGFTTANTQELQVLDGFSFSQATNADTVNISEAGATPVRGQRSFNTSLANVEFSFSTYIRPKLSGTVKAEECHLWNALLSSTAIGATPGSFATITAVTRVGGVLTLTGTGLANVVVGEVVVIKGVTGVGASQHNTAVRILTVTSTTGITAEYVETPVATVPAFASWSAVTFNKTAWNENAAVAADIASTPGIPTAYSTVTTALSNKNQLLPFGMIITVDTVTYVIDNCALDQAVIDFGLDGIAMVAWTGKGTVLRQLATTVAYSAATDPVLSGGITGTSKGKDTTANFITNKLSTVSLISNIGGIAGTPYNLALTGGSITIANLGVVNVPIGYFTGTRAISGSITAYLRTGTTNSAGLLSSLLAASATTAGVEPKFKLQIEIGGATSGTRVEVEASGAMLQIPTVDAQAVMSTTINFTCQGTENTLANNVYDLENTNDLDIRYLSI